MKRFLIDDAFWLLFPDARIGVIVARGIDNRIHDPLAYEPMLWAAQREALRFLGEEELSANPAVAVWRDAFQKFKTKKGARSSIEALLRRVKNEKPIGAIVPLVDLYNVISLRHGLPCGGEDIDRFAGDLRLGLAVGGESFLPLGDEEDAPPYPGELVYKDEAGAVCRCWNWREAQRTMLTEETTNAFLCIESVDPARAEEHRAALDELAALIKKHLGGDVRAQVLTAGEPAAVVLEE